MIAADTAGIKPTVQFIKDYEVKFKNDVLQDLLTQESDMIPDMREGVQMTQWEYMFTSMPTIYRSQMTRALGVFQSWSMNYWFVHQRELLSRMLTGRTMPKRKGQPCKLLTTWRRRAPHNVLIEFKDGFRVVVPMRSGVRRRKDGE